MPKTFTYETEGLSYSVLVYQDPDSGSFFAEVTVTEGAMDLNAIYYGDSDYSGDSAMLDGPLNMNGARLGNDNVQWDDAIALSDPGLGSDGVEKDTYLTSGETYPPIELDITSLDDIDVFGVRATSTTTDDGSIKGVSEEEPEEPTFEKMGFAVEIGSNGGIENGVYVFEEALPEGQDGTFENYVAYYDSRFGADEDYNITQLEAVFFLELVPGTDENGDPIEVPQLLYRLDPPEGGWSSASDLLASYDEAVANGAFDGLTSADEGVELMAALSVDGEFDSTSFESEELEEDTFELV